MSEDRPSVPSNREKLQESENLAGIRFGSVDKWEYPEGVNPTAAYPAEYVRRTGGNATFMG